MATTQPQQPRRKPIPQEPTRQPTPREQAAAVGAEVEAAITAALIAAVAAAGGFAALMVAGYTHEGLRSALVALLRPLAVARVYYIGRLLQQNYTDALPTGVEPFPQMIADLFEQERIYERRFVERSVRRVVADLKRSSDRGDDEAARAEVLRKALAREARFERMRQAAVERRVMEGVSEARVRAVSPEGAYWLLDPSKRTHTADCLAMANKAWTWDVLKVIRPSNRHNTCGCHLISVALAQANGRANANMIRSAPPRVALHGEH